MADRVELQSLLEELLGSKNVYYQPPESVKMQYDLTVIAKRPDHPVIKKLLALPYCSYDRHYVADNLNHDVLTIYY